MYFAHGCVCVRVCMKDMMSSLGKRWVVESKMLLSPASQKCRLGQGCGDVLAIREDWIHTNRSGIVSLFREIRSGSL